MSAEIDEIMKAATPSDLFPDNRKRAGIIYRRLMRFVHPDIDPSDKAREAANRLNQLWTDWQTDHSDSKTTPGTTKPRRHGTTRTERVMRTGTTTIFHVLDDTKDTWLEADANPGAAAGLDDNVKHALAELRTLVKESPVTSPDPGTIRNIAVPQKDGPHAAANYRIPGLNDGWSADDVRAANPRGINGRDAAWLLKRYLYLGGAMEQTGLEPKDTDGTIIAINPEGHTIGLASVRALKHTGDSHALRAVMDEYRMLIGPDTRHGRKLASFAEGCTGNVHPPISELMRELDGTLLDLFGAPEYHPMQNPKGRAD